ncbi:MAG: metal-dependent hydrolase [Candidatus Aenigmarchaeota archaeon]|nr:metal-dependent hydrolase [Candidatus Aenigmarchaeota archaeon]
MDTLFHFIFSFIAGMAVFRGKHKVSVIATIALLSILVDIDHFFGLSARGTFHNVFIVFLVPLVAFITAYFYEKKKSIKLQTYALLLMVMLLGHVTADTFYGGGVMLLYPLSETSFEAPGFLVTITDTFHSPIVSRDGVALAIYAIILLLAVFVEDFIYFFEKKNQKIRDAIKSAKDDLF